MHIDTLIINLNQRQDRYKHITEEIKKIHHISNMCIVEGIVDETKTAFKSHQQCIRIAKERKYPHVLILEDDAIFTDDVNEILVQSLAEAQERNWDVLYLGANLADFATRISNRLIKLTHAYTLHAYIVNSQMYDVILDLPQIFEMDVHYDRIMHAYNMYMCDPIISYQLPNYSDLQNGYRDYNDAIRDNYMRFRPQ